MSRIMMASLALMLLPAGALAGETEPGPSGGDWHAAARQALEQLERALDHLEGMVERLPRYGAPYIDEDGDIVIPRRDSPPLPAPGEPDSVQI